MSDVADGRIEDFLRSHGPFEDSPILANGERVGEWTIRAFLGRGGSAEVYRAENATTGLAAALKVLCKSDDRTRERFKREAQLVAGMRCAAFPKFYGAGSADGRFYIAEELLDPMPLPRCDAAVARFVIAVAAGVEELHKRGFIHRDIKPRNVMMRPSTGESVLIDMGLAKEESVTPQACGDTVSVVDGCAVGVGTPGFSAPEQFAGGKIGPATDVHALGMMVNACFEGKPPRSWAKIIRRSTSSIPEQRYATISELVRAVRRRHALRWWLIGIVTLLVAGVIATISLSPAGDAPRSRGERPQKDIVKRQVIGDKSAVNDEKVKGDRVEASSLFRLGETKYERNVMVTRIALKGKDVSIPGEIRLDGNRRVEILGPGRLTASITGTRDVKLELRGQAALINLTTTPYPESGMKYVLNGACYLNFKNLDGPADGDAKNIWVDDFEGNGTPSFRFRGPDSYEEVRKADQKAALDLMRNGIPAAY